MAKPLVFSLGDHDYPLQLIKIDRSKLYGFKEVEAVDDHDQVCELATLADDGRTMIGKGGTGLGWLDADGQWCEKSKLKPYNVDGDEIKPVASSFNEAIKLFDTVTPAEYLDHNIRLVYAMQFDGPSESENSAADLNELMAELRRGTIFSFPYSYRGGLEADTGFLLLNADDEIMLAVGNRAEIAFVGIQSQITVTEPSDAEEEEGDLMNFEMI